MPAEVRAGLPAHAQRMSSLLALDREFAPCRVAGREYDAGPGAARKSGRRQATAVHAACRGGLDCRLGAGHGEEHTTNMPCMFVTLEMSKLSGWLNADAPCRESKGGHTVRGESAGLEAGGRQVTAVHAQRAGESSTADSEQGTGRSARRTCAPWS